MSAATEKAFQRQMADLGVEVGARGPDGMQILNDAFYTEALPRGLAGIGDAYMDGWWDADQLDVLATKVLAGGLPIRGAGRLALLAGYIKAKLLNSQNRRGGRQVAQKHYNLGNDLFRAMLDPYMVYSCAYWQDARTLDQAQQAKLDLSCRKLGLRQGMRVLDIGCGWGGLARFAAENYGVSVVGITISGEQVSLGRTLSAGLPIELRLQDYRDISGTFDAVVSMGMFEHVGYKNYRRFMRIVRQCLSSGGLFLLETIGGDVSKFRADPWIDRHIFPNGMAPSRRQIAEACEGIFTIQDWHNFGLDYDKTALAWFRNFDANWGALRVRYGQRFYRMWKYYLHIGAAAFRSGTNHNWQIILSNGLPGGYAPVR